ncbi:hypothetical protein SSYRP_v1c05490 [Spiroplasma syrphidicola EA-1]|uniref:Uncharacterized protein n=1 Tax=Spiroplasma syrphidicola EA-1 TaxID=1276229 RepID=R4UE28_9MOLU|nr:hypothetical protein [Spiroplasma syrphidicola]AGM26139.1 hypothetical protein SSYRP_v1c05490 [Spiroplasma syrphidicola EA-1]
MSTLKLDTKIQTLLKFLLNLKLNFVAISRILKTRTDITFEQKSLLLNIIKDKQNLQVLVKERISIKKNNRKVNQTTKNDKKVNIMAQTIEKVKSLRNASNNYNKMGQGQISWINPYYNLKTFQKGTILRTN